MLDMEYSKGGKAKPVKVDEQRYVDTKKMQQIRYDNPASVRSVKREIKEFLQDVWQLRALSTACFSKENVSKELEKGNKGKTFSFL